MTLKSLYPFAGTILMIGISAIMYGTYSKCLLIVGDGLYLTWLGVHVTLEVWDN